MSEPQDVLHVQQQEGGGSCGYNVAFLNLLVDVLQLLQELGVDILAELGQKSVEVEADRVHYLALVYYRIQWVPHFVGDC